jgi:2-(1,2-epoxy-1,2-dihydrophenyl)acetyl-CoA isomerase
MLETIKVDRNGNVTIITLSRPEAMNSFNVQMAKELLQAFSDADNNKAVRAILFRGEGPAFCAGGDIGMFAQNIDNMANMVPDTMEVLNTLISTMLNCRKPILAQAHGSVAGVGVSFILACDLVIASENTKFTMAYAGIGLSPDGGASYLLPRVVGQRRAMQMFLLPDIFSAEEALQMGLINWCVADADLDKATSKLMHKLSNGPNIAYKRVKKLLNQTWDNQVDDQLQAEIHAFTECAISQDFKRGVSAFLAKKKPVFEGS